MTGLTCHLKQNRRRLTQLEFRIELDRGPDPPLGPGIFQLGLVQHGSKPSQNKAL